jgi:hypothetical protein
MAYDQMMEKVESCVYENDVIPPARQEHKTQYNIVYCYQISSIYFSKETVLGPCYEKGLMKGHCQIQEAMSEVQYFK